MTTTRASERESTISSAIHPRVGFHFSSLSRIEVSRPPSCTTLQIQYSLPPDLFVDPYELELHRGAFSYQVFPEPNLELPTFVVPHASTLVLLDIVSNLSHGSLNVTLPLHARYGTSSHSLEPDEAYEILRFPQPIASWQCVSFDGSSYTHNFLLNATIPDVTVFVPVAVVHDRDFVELGTIATVLCVFAYLFRVLIVTAWRIDLQERGGKRE